MREVRSVCGRDPTHLAHLTHNILSASKLVTAWCSEIGFLTSLAACYSGSFSLGDVGEQISLHQAGWLYNYKELVQENISLKLPHLSFQQSRVKLFALDNWTMFIFLWILSRLRPSCLFWHGA